MNENKKNVVSSISLILIAVIYTILVKTIGVVAIGPKFSKVGFANLNLKFSLLFGYNKTFDVLSDLLIIVPVVIASIYTFFGVKQLFKTKNLKKVDKHIVALGIFYVLLGLIYLLFENVVINYRPILEEGELVASYPSSHTVLFVCLCGSSILINKYFYSKYKISKLENKISAITIAVLLACRFISGVHWFTDIIGGILISIALLKSFDTILYCIKSKK